MKLIKPSYEIIPQEEGIQGVYKQIELAGRTCYKSEDRITETSAKDFVDRMIKSGHGAMLEHGTVYLYLPVGCPINGYKYRDNKYSKFIQKRRAERPAPQIETYITTNLRTLIENDWLEDLKYLCEPTEYHEKRISVRFIMDRIGSQSFVRHRIHSFAQESTRFCNYLKEKFGKLVSFIMPLYIKEEDIKEAEQDLIEAEQKYFKWINKGYKAEEARFILPFAIKTELVMTGFASDWKHFFKLRSDKSAHPQARELSIPLEEEFKKLGYV